MKKFILSLICLLVSSFLFAANPLKIAKGEVPRFKKGDIAFFELDLSDTTWEEKETFKKHFENYDRLETRIFEVFCSTYNKYSPTIRISDEGNPNYKFVFHPVDFYCTVDGAFFKKNTRVWGTLSILEMGSGEDLCIIQIIGFPSYQADYVEADSVL